MRPVFGPAVLFFAACGAPIPEGGADGEGATSGGSGRTAYTATAADTLPQVAPGVVLLATLYADGSVDVSGTVQATLWEDLDGADDDRYAFRYRILDENGSAL
jgi:hypothetical protein